jgi:hypothetical protein
MKTLRGGILSFVLAGLLAVVVLSSVGKADNTSPTTFAYAGVVGYCQKSEAKPFTLSEDKQVLCFDGWITSGLDLSVVEALAPGGLFVVRSFGGNIAKAIALARLLQERHASVIVYDYCNSACANYVLIASDRAFVRRHSLVVFHNTVSGLPDCFQFETSRDDGPPTLQSSPCSNVPVEAKARHAYVVELQERFFKERTAGSGFDPPESTHVRRVLKNMLDQTGVYPTHVGWMWNPRYYPSVLKTKITYEAYPESQDEVDELVARYHFRKVIFDP